MFNTPQWKWRQLKQQNMLGVNYFFLKKKLAFLILIDYIFYEPVLILKSQSMLFSVDEWRVMHGTDHLFRFTSQSLCVTKITAKESDSFIFVLEADDPALGCHTREHSPLTGQGCELQL